MRRSVVVLSIALGVGLSSPPRAAAEGPQCPHHGCGHHHGCSGCPDCVAPPAGPGDRGSSGQRGFDPDTVTTLKGSVTAVTVVPARAGRGGGTHVTLSSDGAPMDVHLGPTWFLEQAGLKLAKGDAVEVTGSVVETDGATFLVAREVRKGATQLRLRDERGLPAWAGARRPD